MPFPPVGGMLTIWVGKMGTLGADSIRVDRAGIRAWASCSFVSAGRAAASARRVAAEELAAERGLALFALRAAATLSMRAARKAQL